MKISGFFQLLDTRDGTRSPAVGCSRNDFANSCAKWIDTNPEAAASTLVLVLVDDVVQGAGTQWDFSRAPVLTVTHFVELFGVKQNVA